MTDRDYSVRLDAPQFFRLNGVKHVVTIMPEAKNGDVGYYSIGTSVVLEFVGTIHSAGGPDFSSALNALRAEILKGG